MSKHRTDLSKYKSPSTGDFCTPAQYVAEIICQRQAKHEKAGTLPYKFWNKGKWKSIYIRQIGLANKLIKEFGENMFYNVIAGDDYIRCDAFGNVGRLEVIHV